MSQVHSLQDGSGILLKNERGALFVVGTTKPTDGTAGYEVGCLFLDIDAAAGSILFCNEGTVASCDFDAVSVA
jgi:hypothetical protein